MKNKISKDLISNIKISDDMKRALYRNCIKGRSTADFRFKYATALTALIIIGVFGVFSIGASAAILGFRGRLNNMEEEEYQGYQTEVDNDVFISTDEGFSRELTDSEIQRIMVLERDYYDKGIFPEKLMPHYDTKSEMKEGELAYVREDNIVYLPDKEMDDEQLLQYIDHDAKKRYVNIQELKEEGIESGVNMALESTQIAEGSEDERVREYADKLLKEYFNVVPDDSWVVLVDRFENTPIQSGEYVTVYDIDYYRLGLGYDTSYTFRIIADDMSPMMISENGYETFNSCKTYSFDEAKEHVKEGEETAKEYLKNVGLENYYSYIPDVERYSDDGQTTSCIDYTFYFDDTTVYICYRIEDKRIVSYCRL